MIIVDASAAVDLLLEAAGPGEWVAERLEGERNVGAPQLIDLVGAGLRRFQLVVLARQPAPQKNVQC